VDKMHARTPLAVQRIGGRMTLRQPIAAITVARVPLPSQLLDDHVLCALVAAMPVCAFGPGVLGTRPDAFALGDTTTSSSFDA
jgi:hypothetical protein